MRVLEKDTYTKEVNAVFLTTFVIGFPYMMFLFKPSLPEDLCISRDSLDILTCAGGGAFCILFFLHFVFCCFVFSILHFAFWQKRGGMCIFYTWHIVRGQNFNFTQAGCSLVRILFQLNS